MRYGERGMWTINENLSANTDTPIRCRLYPENLDNWNIGIFIASFYNSNYAALSHPVVRPCSTIRMKKRSGGGRRGFFLFFIFFFNFDSKSTYVPVVTTVNRFYIFATFNDLKLVVCAKLATGHGDFFVRKANQLR